MKSHTDSREMINRAAYPIDELGNGKRQQVITQVRDVLVEDGCAVLAEFFQQGGFKCTLGASTSAARSSRLPAK